MSILTYLLAELSSLKIQVKRLYLDREFFSIAVIRWLQALDIPLAMPAIRRGKKGKSGCDPAPPIGVYPEHRSAYPAPCSGDKPSSVFWARDRAPRENK